MCVQGLTLRWVFPSLVASVHQAGEKIKTNL